MRFFAMLRMTEHVGFRMTNRVAKQPQTCDMESTKQFLLIALLHKTGKMYTGEICIFTLVILTLREVNVGIIIFS